MTPTSTAALSWCLVVVVLARYRPRPGHRLRSPTTVDERDARGDRAAPARTSLRRARRRTVAPEVLAAWCDQLAHDVRSGSSLAAALRRHDPPGPGRLHLVGERLRRGSTLRDATGVDGGSVDERAVLLVLAACARDGGAVAQPLDRLAATLRRRAADGAERAVHSAQARASAAVMTVLPVAMLTLLLVTSAPVRSVVTTPLGAIVVALGTLANVVGWWWMRRIVRGRP